MIVELPPLPIPPDLAVLCDAPGPHVATTLRQALVDGSLGAAHRTVLVNLLARVRPAGLLEIATALEDLDHATATHELAASLADLARTRAVMLGELDR